jgi:hypothetical protein
MYGAFPSTLNRYIVFFPFYLTLLFGGTVFLPQLALPPSIKRAAGCVIDWK